MATAGAVLDIESLTATHERLCRRLRKLDRNATCGMVAGLMVDPSLQGGILRLEVLAHLAAAHCGGQEKPSAARIRDFLNNDLARGAVWRLEDPSEDVFVSNITTGAGDFRILEGTWEANAAYTQSCLSALNSAIADGHEWAQHGMRQANALLAIGEAVAERAGLRRYQAGEGKARDRFRFDTAKALRACAAVTFTEAELRAIGVEPFDLLPFDFSRIDPQLLRNETINWTSLERWPVSRTEDGIVVLLPTAIGAAVRRRALELARDNQAGDAYEGHLTEHQFLGAVGDAVRGLDLSPAAPPWSDVQSHCVVQLCRFDAGAYCQVIFVPDRPDDVIAEGFRSVQDVSAPVRRLMRQAAAECSARDDYLRGMTLLVFGGQGRGVVADHGRPPDCWQIVGLGYDDLSLLASAGEIDALRIFRVLEQEDQLARRGIQLFNPNGFMNLYGMVEEQDFTLLPEQVDHSAPSMIQMGTDHLSKLRIRIRQALDKHSVARPSRGYRAEVQRPSALPLFEAASTESAFVSVDDLRHGHPAVAIEGSRTTWWLTVEAIDPITAGSLPFRVWDMAQNWLIPLAPELEIHLGEELPRHIEVASEHSVEPIPEQPVAYQYRAVVCDLTVLGTLKVALCNQTIALEQDPSPLSVIPVAAPTAIRTAIRPANDITAIRRAGKLPEKAKISYGEKPIGEEVKRAARRVLGLRGRGPRGFRCRSRCKFGEPAPKTFHVDHPARVRKLLTADTIAIAIKVPGISRVASPDGCCPRSTCRGAIRIVYSPACWPTLPCLRGLSAVAMTTTVLAIIVTSVGRETSGMGRSGGRPHKRSNCDHQRSEHKRCDQPKLQPDQPTALFALPIAPIPQRHSCLPQYRSHRAAQPPRTIAHDKSPDFGEVHHAPVRSPPAEPVETHRIGGPATRT